MTVSSSLDCLLGGGLAFISHKPRCLMDLTEAGCLLAGKILADLGADVIKIETPGGSTSRIAPFCGNIPEPEKSLFGFAYNVNKKA